MTNSCSRVYQPFAFPNRKSAMASLTKPLSLALGLLSLAACATTKLDMSTTTPSPDRRGGLRAGGTKAGGASLDLLVGSQTPPPGKFACGTDSGPALTANFA